MAHLPPRPYTIPEILHILNTTPTTTTTTITTTLKRHYCTWCGLAGHRKTSCTDLTAAFKLGVVRTRRGKICLVDGGKIPWPHGERCLKDWVLKNARAGEVEKWRRETGGRGGRCDAKAE